MAPDQRQRHEAVADAVVLGTGNPEPGATSSCLMGLAVGWGRQMPNPAPSWNRVTNAPASRGPPEDKTTQCTGGSACRGCSVRVGSPGSEELTERTPRRFWHTADAQQTAVLIARRVVLLVKPQLKITVTLGPGPPTRCLRVPDMPLRLSGPGFPRLWPGVLRGGEGDMRRDRPPRKVHDCFVVRTAAAVSLASWLEIDWGFPPPPHQGTVRSCRVVFPSWKDTGHFIQPCNPHRHAQAGPWTLCGHGRT